MRICRKWAVRSRYNSSQSCSRSAVSVTPSNSAANAVRAYRTVVEVGAAQEPEVKRAQRFLDDIAGTIRQNEGVDLEAYLESQDEFDRAFALMEQGDWLRALAGFRAAAAKNGQCADARQHRSMPRQTGPKGRGPG